MSIFHHANRSPQDLITGKLAAKITKAASKQTYYTIRFLADRDLVADAYRAYAYFRWVDDCLDSGDASLAERRAFLHRQQALLQACYEENPPEAASLEEELLICLARKDKDLGSGLYSYLSNMMAVMAFDVDRRSRLISQAELAEYSRWLATAVTDALHYFIGHHCPPPCSEARYRAVLGAHIAHMLRDTVEDTAAGYFNIPLEVLEKNNINPQDIHHPAYREWVRSRVGFARQCFRQGRGYTAQVKNLRCRLASWAYIARFEWLLKVIERDGYFLRESYEKRKSLGAGLWMFWDALQSFFSSGRASNDLDGPAVRPVHLDEV